ncbi:hypothetical protein [Microbacterium sp.]|uniref:hypothetical protein n=1 Tax=Microbacterium sp. TaxID=51671 RepID=UPI00289A7DDE|nr:hypothetical protein [Microbacterium sp.]
MSRRDRERVVRETGPEAWGAYLRERIYATLTGLAIVLVVGSSEHAEPDHAFLALVLGVIGIVVAGLVSDIVSHLLSRGALPSAEELLTFVRIAGGGLSTVVTPGILLLLAWLDVLDSKTPSPHRRSSTSPPSPSSAASRCASPTCPAACAWSCSRCSSAWASS